MKYSFLENKYNHILKESKQDQEVLKEFLGDDYYTKYNNIKNKISDNEYKDIYSILKKDVDDVKEYIDSFKSNREIIKNTKKGATKIYEDSDWVVYKITTYPAAVAYGKGTKWCITGRYPGHEGRGESYFNSYIKDNNLDGGYYFYITKDGSGEKYCVLQTKDKKIHSIWTEEDVNMGDSTNNLDDYGVVLPQIPEVNITKNPLVDLMEAIDNNNEALVKKIISTDLDINKSFHGTKPLYKAIRKGNTKIVDLLIKSGAKLDNSIIKDVLNYEDDYNMLNHLFDKYIFIDTNVVLYAINNYNAMKSILDRGYDPTRWRDSKGQDLLEYSTGRVRNLLEPYFDEEGYF